MSTEPTVDQLWYLRLVCCGRDDGLMTFGTWSDADAFRDSYTTGPGVDGRGFSSSPPSGHQRAAILEVVTP